MPTHIALLTGGQSSEREIALQSAQVIAALLKNEQISIFDFPNDLNRFLSERHRIDIAIPIFHGQGGEDGTIQGFLKTLSIPFLFSDVAAHALALDKTQTKRIVASAGLKTPDFIQVTPHDSVQFKYPCVIKPVNGGSSIGISLVQTETEFQPALEQAFKHANQVLIEKYIQGDEFTVAIIEEAGQALALPVIQIKSKNHFFDYASKYDAKLVDEICPAPIDPGLRDRLQTFALTVHRLIGARHLTRSDFMVDKEGTVWFLEINTIPGQTLQSLVPKAIRASGRDFGQVLRAWIQETR